MGVRSIEPEPPERDTRAEHGVATVHLGKKRCDRLIGGGCSSGSEAAAQSEAANRAMLEPEANRGGVVVILLNHLGRRAARERDWQRLERSPADVSVVEADGGPLEASIGEPGLDLRRVANLGAGSLRGEGTACRKLTGDQGIDWCTCRQTERVVRRKEEPGWPLLESRVGVVVREGELRKKARSSFPRGSELPVHSNGEAIGAARSLETHTGEFCARRNTELAKGGAGRRCDSREINRLDQLDRRVTIDRTAADRPVIGQLEGDVRLHINRLQRCFLCGEAAGKVVRPLGPQSIRNDE